jgi:hypothetical protein
MAASSFRTDYEDFSILIIKSIFSFLVVVIEVTSTLAPRSVLQRDVHSIAKNRFFGPKRELKRDTSRSLASSGIYSIATSLSGRGR